MADPAGRLVEHLPDRELQPVAPLGRAHDRDGAAVRRPVRVAHVLEQVARRAPGQGRLGERADPRVSRRKIQQLQDEHLPRARNRLDLAFGKRQPKRLGALHSNGIEARIPSAVPSRGIDDRLAIRSKRAEAIGPRRYVSRWNVGNAGLAFQISRPARIPIARAPAAATTTALAGNRDRILSVDGSPRAAETPDRASRSKARSWPNGTAARGSSRGSGARSAPSPGGTFWFRMEMSGGSSLRIADIVSPRRSRRERALPASIS